MEKIRIVYKIKKKPQKILTRRQNYTQNYFETKTAYKIIAFALCKHIQINIYQLVFLNGDAKSPYLTNLYLMRRIPKMSNSVIWVQTNPAQPNGTEPNASNK